MKPILLAVALVLFSTTATAAAPVATILCYHEVDASPTHSTVARRDADNQVPPTMEARRYTATPSEFAAQLDTLDALGYTVIPLAHLSDFIAGCRADLPQKAVVITVDDGWACSYTDIYPELQRRGLPWTLFVYPKIVGRGSHAVTWPQVAEMSRAGVDIQSHSLTHPFLTMRNNGKVPLPEYEGFLRSEFLTSRSRIEAATGKPVRFFCYPYGDQDAVVADALRRYGYESAVTTIRGPVTAESAPMQLPRYLIHNTTTLEQFRSFLH